MPECGKYYVFSKESRKPDRNTVGYMIGELQNEVVKNSFFHI